uniref:Uncharacterized protein n=1 Tax=Tetranychus urticae TaxID=32264 RepID=T1KCJ3_TETUR
MVNKTLSDWFIDVTLGSSNAVTSCQLLEKQSNHANPKYHEYPWKVTYFQKECEYHVQRGNYQDHVRG